MSARHQKITETILISREILNGISWRTVLLELAFHGGRERTKREDGERVIFSSLILSNLRVRIQVGK